MQPSYQSGFYAPGRGVAKHPELWRGCVGAWNPGLGNTGLSLRDWSGSQNNGTLTNGPTWGVSDGRQALDFDGVNDSVNCGGGIPTSSITAMTQSVWVRNDVAATNKAIVGWYDGNGIFIQSRIDASDGFLVVAGGSSSWGQTLHTTEGLWLHAALVYDGTLTGDSNRLKLYVNGVQKSLGFQGAIPSAISLGGNLKIGDVGSLGRYWNGLITDIRIYNRALSQQEVRTLATRPGIAYELAQRKTYFIQAATSTSQFYDVLSPLIFAGTN